jgi:threonine synthase
MAKKSKMVESGPQVAADSYKSPEDRKSGWSEWEVRDALRTLTTAMKIRKNPSLMRAVRAEARRQQQAAEAVSKSI